ncbi:hypothetical protein TNCV_2057291 [Trichonephila clavipes]|nr:hypothetical protein TNCV_2057291 [Trichonephila clavipes]
MLIFSERRVQPNNRFLKRLKGLIAKQMILHDHRNPHDPGNYTNDWLDQSAASYMLAGYSPQSFLIYFSDMGWRLASRAICPENVTVVTVVTG